MQVTSLVRRKIDESNWNCVTRIGATHERHHYTYIGVCGFTHTCIYGMYIYPFFTRYIANPCGVIYYNVCSIDCRIYVSLCLCVCLCVIEEMLAQFAYGFLQRARALCETSLVSSLPPRTKPDNDRYMCAFSGQSHLHNQTTSLFRLRAYIYAHKSRCQYNSHQTHTHRKRFALLRAPQTPKSATN